MAMKFFNLAITMIIAAYYCTSLAVGVGDTLFLGASLSAYQTLISKNGTFELGFFSPRGTKNYYIGIWYAQIPEKTIVWVANRENPVKRMAGSVFQISTDGGLRLFDGTGLSVWSTDIGLRGSRAVMMDSGNFIMMDAHNKSEIVWESFAHPTDTWLPGMKLWKGMRGSSWKSSMDPSSGLFSLGMDMSPGKTQLVMSYNNSVPFWSTGEWLGNYLTNVPEVYAPRRFQMSCVRLSPSRIYYTFNVIMADHALTGRILISEKGELKLYYWMDDGTWSQGWSSFQGQCNDYDICGAYGLCNADDVCTCVQGFTPNKHDSQGWWLNGCSRQRPLQCSVTEGTTDGFLEAKNQYLSEKGAVVYREPTVQEGCRTACLNNCSCTAFAFVISDPPVCTLWFGDLFKLRVSSENQSVFIRLADSELGHSTTMGRSKHRHLGTFVPASVGAIVVVFGFLAAGFFLWRRGRRLKKKMESEVPTSLRTFTYRELQIATQNFKHKLGSGAFGSVFKGALPDNTLVAVKRLEGAAQAEKQFRAEISTIGSIQHVNLVRLWGFCVQGSQRLLVYAYMPNGSLNSCLFRKEEDEEEETKVLDWKTRFEIALGIARGLLYLHEECRDRIIHCDIKPENILLDDDFSPKVADFGLAKLVGRDFSRVLTSTRGTRGYLAPEWLSGLPITPKADVFSFGMTLLEIISGRRNLDMNVEESRFYFPTWASSQIQGGSILGIVDTRIANEADTEEVRRVAMVAMLCIQDIENTRPTIGEVINMLKGTTDTPVAQIPRYLEVLVDQGDDQDSNSLKIISTSKIMEGRHSST